MVASGLVKFGSRTVCINNSYLMWKATLLYIDSIHFEGFSVPE